MRHAAVRVWDTIGCLYGNLPSVFGRLFLGPDGHLDPGAALRRFWAQVPVWDTRRQRLLDAMLPRPDIAGEDDLFSRAVPLVLHGDGVPVGGRASLDVISISGALAQGVKTVDAKMILTGFASRCKTAAGVRTMWSVVLWVLLALQSGVRPCRDWEGEPLLGGGGAFAGGLIFIVWIVHAD